MKSRSYIYSSFIILSLFLLMTGCSSSKTQVNSDTTFSLNDYPLIFRRTTLIVHDIEESLALYRDAMGMEITYDNIIKRPHPDGDGEQHIRLVFLKATHDYVGVIGLVDYEYNKRDKIRKANRRQGFTAQNSVMIFNTNDLKSSFEKIKKVKGVEVVKEPEIRTYPSYDGTNVIKVLVSIFYDPDGFLVEYNQVLEGM